MWRVDANISRSFDGEGAMKKMHTVTNVEQRMVKSTTTDSLIKSALKLPQQAEEHSRTQEAAIIRCDDSDRLDESVSLTVEWNMSRG